MPHAIQVAALSLLVSVGGCEQQRTPTAGGERAAPSTTGQRFTGQPPAAQRGLDPAQGSSDDAQGAKPRNAAPNTSAARREQQKRPQRVEELAQRWQASSASAAGEPDFPVGTPIELPMPRDRSLRVTHAAPNKTGAFVYLQGMCGNPKGADPWVDLAARRGTFIVVRANVKCPDRPGYKWPKDPALIQKRIDEALSEVKKRRAGQLDTEQVTLVGYSQGSHRAELLAASYPERYPFIVMGGPPTSAEPANFAQAARVAVLGGELENTQHMELGVEELRAANIDARFFVLPSSHHGSYGPRGPEVMSEVFDWLFGEPTSR